jgi:hypothetical protein
LALVAHTNAQAIQMIDRLSHQRATAVHIPLEQTHQSLPYGPLGRIVREECRTRVK